MGVQQEPDAVRHAHVPDAHPPVDRRLYRLDGGPLLRVVDDDAVPLPRPVGTLGGAVEGPALPAVPRLHPGTGPPTPPATRGALLRGVLRAARQRGPCAPRVHRGRQQRAVDRLPRGRRPAGRGPRPRAGRVHRRRARDLAGPRRRGLPGRLRRRPPHGRGTRGVATRAGRRGARTAAVAAGGRVRHRGGGRQRFVRGGPDRRARRRQGLVLPQLEGGRRRRAVADHAQPDGRRPDGGVGVAHLREDGHRHPRHVPDPRGPRRPRRAVAPPGTHLADGRLVRRARGRARRRCGPRPLGRSSCDGARPGDSGRPGRWGRPGRRGRRG